MELSQEASHKFLATANPRRSVIVSSVDFRFAHFILSIKTPDSVELRSVGDEWESLIDRAPYLRERIRSFNRNYSGMILRSTLISTIITFAILVSTGLYILLPLKKRIRLPE
jgi:hypothetical protein